jgi:hypothetical protein
MKADSARGVNRQADAIAMQINTGWGLSRRLKESIYGTFANCRAAQAGKAVARPQPLYESIQ